MDASAQTSNLLLQCLSPHVLAAVTVDLEPVALPLRYTMESIGEAVEHVYFIESGIASRVARCGKEQIEIGLLGFEGATGTLFVHHASVSPLDVFMQEPGHGWRMTAEAFREHTSEHEELRHLFLRFAYVQATQTAQSCLCNARFTVLERTARWLLMCHDRMRSDEFHLTHDFLGLMIGARRAGVTCEMHVLEGAHAIRNSRGLITIRERGKLEEIAGHSYGVPEAHYAALIGRQLRMTIATL